MVRVGKIVNCHGHKGELKVVPLTDDLKRFDDLKEVYLELGNNRYDLVHIGGVRTHKNNILMTLDEVKDMNQAEKIKNIYLCVKDEDVVDLPKDHYFLYEIKGLTVVEDGVTLGKIVDILQTGSNDVYVVKNVDREFYLPALKSVVLGIDLAEKIMTVSLPAGLLD